MREYRFQASDDTVAGLRLLRGRWSGFVVSELAMVVMLVDGRRVRLQVEAADVEDMFEAFRIEAITEPAGSDASIGEIGAVTETPGDFAAGSNDVVLFTGAFWSEGGAQPTFDSLAGSPIPTTSTMHFSGHPGQLSETADVVCLTTDAVVIAATTGDGLLVRTGLKPLSLEVSRDREKIAEFLLERGYRAE
ncbi:MAG TPA: hypothetical protein VE869_14560 [Gemmatimonas sp.]|nr:hypothetical protein [Gemmatimonas sp.]